MTYGYRLRCMASNRKTRVLLSSRKNLIALMAYRVTKPRSPRGSARANVETMGGRRSRYWCGLCSGGETKPALLSERYQAVERSASSYKGK